MSAAPDTRPVAPGLEHALSATEGRLAALHDALLARDPLAIERQADELQRALSHAASTFMAAARTGADHVQHFDTIGNLDDEALALRQARPAQRAALALHLVGRLPGADDHLAHTPHGLANAIMLPHVLKYSAPSITDKLAQLAVRAKVGTEEESSEVLAQKFLDAVDQLNADLGIPLVLDALQESDIPDLARAACHEAHTGYPVPRYMTQAQCEDMIRKVLPGAAKVAAPKKKKA